MQITLRLHRQHDMDLINLYFRPHFKFQKEVKRALIDYASGRVSQIILPDEVPEEGYVSKTVLMHISLNPDKAEDKEAINLLKAVKKGYRNSFIKAVFRLSLPSLPLTSFMSDSGFRVKKVSIFDTADGRCPKKQNTSVSDQNIPKQTADDITGTISHKEDKTPQTDDYEVTEDSQTESLSDDVDFGSLFAEMAALNH